MTFPIQILRSGAILLMATAIMTTLSLTQSHAMKIQTVVSGKGITAWLVEDHRLPLISMRFGFEAGSAHDPAGKEGTANLVARTLDEGAGDLTSQQFQQRLEDLAVKLEFSVNHDHFTGTFQTLSDNRAEAFDLLRMALTQPRFDADAVERMRASTISRIKFEEKDPERMAARALFQTVFAGHPYANPVNGTLESVAAITPDDLRAFAKAAFARGNLKVAVVGDITAAELKAVLDSVFGDLPETSAVQPIAAPDFKGAGVTRIIPMPNPQSVVQFGLNAPKRKDEDFVPAFVLNYILGGGGFASKLMEEVREKRGLAYSVYTYLYTLDKQGMLLGGVATENKSVGKSLEVIKSVMQRLAAEGPTEAELEGAKKYLTGSYALRFDSSSKIASQLLGIQLEGFGPDYIEKRNGLIEAVTAEDVRRVAQRILRMDALVVTVVGQPEGVTGTN